VGGAWSAVGGAWSAVGGAWSAVGGAEWGSGLEQRAAQRAAWRGGAAGAAHARTQVRAVWETWYRVVPARLRASCKHTREAAESR